MLTATNTNSTVKPAERLFYAYLKLLRTPLHAATFNIRFFRQLNGYYNDIALFKLDRPVDYNEYTIPVCLPDEYEGTALDTLVGRTSSVIGWGVTAYGKLHKWAEQCPTDSSTVNRRTCMSDLMISGLIESGGKSSDDLQHLHVFKQKLSKGNSVSLRSNVHDRVIHVYVFHALLLKN